MTLPHWRRLSTDDLSVYCGSPQAIASATEAFAAREGWPVPSGALADALIAAHHPDLGLDRSVCLRDVVDALRLAYGFVRDEMKPYEFIEREFCQRDESEDSMTDKSSCGFCKGKPVGNAASWSNGKRLPALPCPRCGVLTPHPTPDGKAP